MLVSIERNDNGSYKVKSETSSYIVKRMNKRSHWGMWYEGDEGDDDNTLHEAPTEVEMIGHAVIYCNH